ncbi:MAG: hypothetical protein M3323_05220 [Actinomycetota bacterium]|nr:hypothetical protein [Actinomycetota bacterium]
MWNFVFGCFILGAATVGLLHGELASVVGIVVVLLWFAGLFRPARTIWLSFLQVGAVAGSILYGYEAFVSDLSTPVLVIGGSILGALVLASAVACARVVIAARRESGAAPVVRSPFRQRRLRGPLWAEVVAWIVLVGLPFGIGVWAAEADFDDRQQQTSTP